MSTNRIDDDQILMAVLTSGSFTEAAKVLGISKQTISRRMKDEQLRGRVIEYRKSLLDAVNVQLMSGATKAVGVLIELLDSENEISRYNASSKILSLVQDFVEMEDVICQIDQIKMEMAQRKGEV